MKRLDINDYYVGMKVKVLERPSVWNNLATNNDPIQGIIRYPIIGEVVKIVHKDGLYPAMGILYDGIIWSFGMRMITTKCEEVLFINKNIIII